MARITRRSNPTGLLELSNLQVTLALSEIDEERWVALTRIDLGKHSLPDNAKVVCIARTGRSSQRIELGELSNWDRSPKQLVDLEQSEPLSFRVLIRAPDSARLLAAAENVRLRSPGQTESLLPIETADLGQLIWRLTFDDDAGPVLQINAKVYPSSSVAEQDSQFTALVLPEALRRVSQRFTDDPDALDDDSDWRGAWRDWLEKIGADLPPPRHDDEEKAAQAWIEGVIERFCEQNQLAKRLIAQRDAQRG